MEFFEKKYFQLNEIRPVSWFDKGSYTNHVDSHGGRGVSEMSTLLIMPKYLVKLSMKWEGGGSKKSNKWSTWFVHDPQDIVEQKGAK